MVCKHVVSGRDSTITVAQWPGREGGEVPATGIDLNSNLVSDSIGWFERLSVCVCHQDQAPSEEGLYGSLDVGIKVIDPSSESVTSS